MPESDRAEVSRLADLSVERDEGMRDLPPRAIKASLELVAYYAGLVAQRRVQRRDDLTPHLMDAVADGGSFRDDELIAFLSTLTGAGNDTVLHLLASAMYWGWEYPQQRDRAFHGFVRPWVEETLRYDTPTQFVARTTRAEVHTGMARIPAGARVVLLTGSANRDPDVFLEPDRYDLTRDTSLAIGFGNGRHACLGASVARLEAIVALEEVVASIRGYEIDVAGIRKTAAPELRGFDEMPVIVTSKR